MVLLCNQLYVLIENFIPICLEHNSLELSSYLIK